MLTKEKPKKEILSANEAGELLGLSGQTVKVKAAAGQIPGFRPGMRWKFRRSDIEAYIEAKIQEHQRNNS